MEAKDLIFISKDRRTRTGAYFLLAIETIDIEVRKMVGPKPDDFVQAQLDLFYESKARAELYLKVMIVILEALDERVIEIREAYRASREYDAKMQDEVVLLTTIGDLIMEMAAFGFSDVEDHSRDMTRYYAPERGLIFHAPPMILPFDPRHIAL